jgi:hypothetical protein
MASSSASSTGPWSLGGSYDTNPHGQFEVYGAEFGRYATGRVAVVERRAGGAYLADSVSPHAQRLTAEANARLIAAAPAMLEALHGLKKCAAITAERLDIDSSAAIWAWISEAQDALMQATGGADQ